MDTPSPLPADPASPQAELVRLRVEVAQLAAALEFHERDRQLLAFEIHDGIVQDMSAAAMFLEAAGARATFAVADRASFDKGLHTLRGAIQEARRLIQGLIPVVLDERGVVASLEQVVQRFREDCALVIDFLLEVTQPQLPPPVEMTVLRIVQEALQNVWKHSKSPKVEVRLRQTEDSFFVVVQDWGVGFDLGQVKRTRYGLVGIKERARLFGGVATITSAPGQGTTVQVELPLEVAGDKRA